MPIDDRPDLLARDAWKDLPVPCKPLRGFVCIIREDPQIHTRIILDPQGRKARRTVMGEARVLAVGDAILHSSGGWIEPQVERGDRVLTQGHNGFCTHKTTPTSDVEYELLQFGQIASILEEPPEVEVPDVSEHLELENQPVPKPKLLPVLDKNGIPVIGAAK